MHIAHNSRAMASDRPSAPMLEAYLNQLKPPPQAFPIPDWVDWVLGIGVFFGVEKLHIGAGFWIAFAAGAAACSIMGATRRAFNSRKSPAVRAAIEQYEKAEELAKAAHDHHVHKVLPEPVLEALERAAISWHEARTQTMTLSTSEAAIWQEIVAQIDGAMLATVAVTYPVQRKDDQSRRSFERMKENEQLMESIVRLVESQSARLHGWAAQSHAMSMTSGSLESELMKVRSERAQAEQELQNFLGQSGV